jgi:hypothetical protein
MQHIQGILRNQLQMVSLEDTITSDNPVRFIDAFVEHIDLVTIGFNPKVLQLEGRLAKRSVLPKSCANVS